MIITNNSPNNFQVNVNIHQQNHVFATAQNVAAAHSLNQYSELFSCEAVIWITFVITARITKNDDNPKLK